MYTIFFNIINFIASEDRTNCVYHVVSGKIKNIVIAAYEDKYFRIFDINGDVQYHYNIYNNNSNVLSLVK
jgi:hypothetical protein